MGLGGASVDLVLILLRLLGRPEHSQTKKSWRSRSFFSHPSIPQYHDLNSCIIFLYQVRFHFTTNPTFMLTLMTSTFDVHAILKSPHPHMFHTLMPYSYSSFNIFFSSDFDNHSPSCSPHFLLPTLGFLFFSLCIKYTTPTFALRNFPCNIQQAFSFRNSHTQTVSFGRKFILWSFFAFRTFLFPF